MIVASYQESQLDQSRRARQGEWLMQIKPRPPLAAYRNTESTVMQTATSTRVARTYISRDIMSQTLRSIEEPDPDELRRLQRGHRTA